MSVPVAAFSPEETIRLLAERAKTSSDKFVVKVSRRRGMAGLLEHIATLTDASVAHVANPETWLPVLCGGGDYGLQVAHMDDVSMRLGGVLPFKFPGQPYETVQVRALQSNAWNGPGTIIFPAATESGLPNGYAGATISGIGQGAMSGGQPQNQFQAQNSGPSFQSGYGLPPSSQPAPVIPGAYQMPETGRMSEWERLSRLEWERNQREMKDAAERERARLERESKELAERQAKLDRALAEREFELREKEREAKLKEEVTARQRELEAKLVSQNANQSNTKELIAAIAPIVLTFIQQSQQQRIEAMRMQEESQRRFAEMMQAQSQQMQVLMLKAAEPKGMDPSTQMMLEMMRANSTGSAEMMTRIVDAMGTVSQTSVGMIEAIAELQIGQQGPSEHPLLAAVREGVRAMATLSQGAQSGARKVVQAQTQSPQLPARNPAPAPQAPQQARPQNMPPPPAPAPQAKPTNGATGPQVVHAVPNAPPPNMAPVSETGQQAFAGYEPGNMTPVEGNVVARLKELIMAHHEPVEAVAQFFADSLKTDEMKAALGKYEGDLNGLVMEELGAWAMSDEKNAAYLMKLGSAIEKLGKELGLFAEEEGGEEGDEAEIGA